MGPFRGFHGGPGGEKIPRRVGGKSEFVVAKIRENEGERRAFLAVLELEKTGPREENRGDDVVDGGVGGEKGDLVVERNELGFASEFLAAHGEEKENEGKGIVETSDGRGGERVELGGLLEIVLHLADLDAALSGLRSEEKKGERDHGENVAELEEGLDRREERELRWWCGNHRISFGSNRLRTRSPTNKHKERSKHGRETPYRPGNES